jgi:hypothetical protein
MYKKLSPQVLRRTFKWLQEPRRDAEFYEFHFGQGPEGGVGSYAAHFKGSDLRDAQEDNLLVLEFPFDFLETVSSDRFVQFVRAVAETIPFESGNAGYAFQHPQTFSSKTPDAINAMLPRYLGFEPSYYESRTDMRGHCPSVNWINFLDSRLTDKVGGLQRVRKVLPGSVAVEPIKGGTMIRATGLPFVGDVSQGAKDIGHAPDVARLLREVRYSTTGFGTPDFAPGPWLARFDERESIPAVDQTASPDRKR